MAVALVASFVVSVLYAQPSGAVQREARNSAEAAARANCDTGTQGAIWFSSSNSFSDGGYGKGFYEMNVRVPATPGAATVYIHGSANTCLQSVNYPNRTFYAINVRPEGVNSHRLFGLESTVMNRGTFVGSYKAHDWTSIPPSSNGYIKAKLNVDGLVAPGETKEIKIGLYRCPSYNGSTVTGGCGIQEVAVLVTRDKPAGVYNYYPYTDVVDGEGNVVTGDKITYVPGTKVNINSWVYNHGDRDNSVGEELQYTYYMFKIGKDRLSSGVSRPVFNSPVTRSQYLKWTPGLVTNKKNSAIPPYGFGVDAEYPTSGTYGCEWLSGVFNLGAYGVVSSSGVLFGRPTPIGPATCGIAPKASGVNDGFSGGAEVFNATSSPNNTQKIGNIEVDIGGPGSSFQIGDLMCGFLAIRSYDYNHRVRVESGKGTRDYFSSGVFDALPPEYRNSLDSYYYGSGNRPQRRLSVPRCLEVVSQSKYPKVQFHGADIRSAKEVGAPARNEKNRLYGSWAEYGLFSRQAASSSSGAGLSSGATGRGDMSAINYNKLTFANISSPFGNYDAPASAVPQSFLGAGRNIASTTVSVDSLSSGIHTRSGSLTIRGGDISSGRRVVVRVTGNVVIAGDIRYANGSHGSLSTVPQLVIIANNIIINTGVRNIDAWLIASGTGSDGYITTCNTGFSAAAASPLTDGLNSGVCNNELRLNGPVLANRLFLRRTFGAEEANPGVPAEIFNLRPDTYLSNYDANRNSGSIKTSYVKELPPRF